MLRKFSRLFISVFPLALFCSPLLAQSDLPETPTPPKLKTLKNASATAKEATKPLTRANEDPRLDHILKLVTISKANRQKQLKDIANGSSKPWQDMERKKQELAKPIQSIKDLIAQLNTATNPTQVKQLESKIFSALQPVGPYLQSADYYRIDNRLTKEQEAILEEMDMTSTASLPLDPENLHTSDDSDSNSIRLNGLDFAYTLTFLPCPISISSKPGTTVYLRSGGGGVFENGLPRCKLTIGKSGILNTYWHTKGDSAGLTSLIISSPQAINQLDLDVITVKPVFQLPPMAPATIPTVIPANPQAPKLPLKP